ncbi:thioredoxin [Patescibacteria group bacterium]|nr:thioredoxin [Patescibacteria group bacterium]
MPQVAINATDETFDKEVLQAEKPVLVDFWASWCGPCQMLKPTVEKIAEEMKDKIKVVLVEVDHSPSSAGKYNVMSVPTLLIIEKGQVKSQMIGAQSEEDLKAKINEAIK